MRRVVIERRHLDAAGKLREIVRLTALRQATQAERFRLLIRYEAELPAELSDAYDTSRRAVLRAVTGVIEEGIRAGRFRPVDARIAALGVIGMWNWVAWLFRPGRPRAAAGADPHGRAAIEWGVYGVPETFIIGRDGRIVYKLVGPITPENLDTALKPEIEKALAAAGS